MKIPLSPPPSVGLLARASADPQKLLDLLRRGEVAPGGKYRHWDTLRRLDPPGGLDHEEWWTAIKLARMPLLRPIELVDRQHRPFQYGLSDPVLEQVHHVDRNASGRIEIAEEVTNPATRDRYIVSSLIEEATTSSQLEGASTTREVARDLIRTGRKPRDRSERMILNNYAAIQRVRELRDTELTPDLVLELHRIVVEQTLDSADAVGRFRRPEERVSVYDDRDQVLHVPPDAAELPERLEQMCAFANGASNHFVPPVVRAILLHFWLAYDHPFVDGNGRTARALFYWSMLREGYWLCEYVSISRILRKAPVRYGRAFLYTETDDNDLTYFLLFHLGVLRRAIEDLGSYLKRKALEVREVQALLRSSPLLNHRQLALLTHALKHPGQHYTVQSHRASHAIVYETARSDLLDLVERGLLARSPMGRKHVFSAPADLTERLKRVSPRRAARADGGGQDE